MKKAIYILLSLIISVTTFNISAADPVFSVSSTTMSQDYTVGIGDTYERIINYRYTGTSTASISLAGDKKNTGLLLDPSYYQADGSYSMKIRGLAIAPGKFKMKLIFSDKGNKNNKMEYPFVLEVKGLTFATSTLPTAYGLRKLYTTKIYFDNPTKSKPKFSYIFPLEFGRVNTEVEEGKDYTTISFYPDKEKKYTIYVTAYNDKNISIGKAKFTLKVVAKDTQTTPPSKATSTATKAKNSFTIKAVKWFSW